VGKGLPMCLARLQPRTAKTPTSMRGTGSLDMPISKVIAAWSTPKAKNAWRICGQRALEVGRVGRVLESAHVQHSVQAAAACAGNACMPGHEHASPRMQQTCGRNQFIPCMQAVGQGNSSVSFLDSREMGCPGHDAITQHKHAPNDRPQRGIYISHSTQQLTHDMR